MENEKLFINRLIDPKTKDKAFRELVRLYQERLYWHIRKILISHEDTNDVLQNTFIKVHKGIANFKGDSKLFSWMYRIATNESITFLNKRAKEKNVSIDEYQITSIHSLQDDILFDGSAIQEILQKAIQELPHKQRLVFNMKYFDNLKYEEISEILDTSVGALKASYFHAVKKIKQHIEEH
ncbi:RNA polymerase sigma factor [Flavicella sp.]|uniref:RNA polymerase sigma factor n=1 Tax=Flavicella sp. TaxID=2957742 RepID=UPI00261F710D|nr:RNA polymerase sigma factor [Flavicella sp.]MDG1804249.1 RNA polymerase sigma factor [Flavicella sp.]